MRTSRLAVFHGKDRPFTYETVTVPALRPGEILVRNEYTTLCRSDLNTYCGKRTELTPTILGHEIVGLIEELGPGAPEVDARGTALRAGDRVTWAIYAADPNTDLARRGMPQKGPGLFKYGHERITSESSLHGGLSEYCILRRHTPVVRLRGSMPLPVLALINCAVATVAGSLRVAGKVRGSKVVVAGAGMLGLVACAMARTLEAERVVAVDVSEERLNTARQFGVDDTVCLRGEGRSLRDELTGRFGAGTAPDLVLDYSGVPETMEAAVRSLGVGGTAVFVGATFPQRPLRIEAEQLVRRLLTLKGLHNYNQADLVTAVEFFEGYHDRFPFVTLVEDRFDLDTVDAAFAHGLNSGAYRVGVRC
jgi:putative phosphonate catabolism associated alcohol dehydrogenase